MKNRIRPFFFVTASLLTVLFFFVQPADVQAQNSYPQQKYRALNDFADVIVPSDEVEILATLKKLRAETGIEVEIVTIDSIRDYDSSHRTIESFATGMFNDWGIGDRLKNDGVLMLVAVRDREVRIEVGSGYGITQNIKMERVINEHLLPHFRQDLYSQGITRGTGAVVKELTGRWPQNIDSSRIQPERVESESNFNWGPVFLLIALIGGSIIWAKVAAELGFDTSGSSYNDDDDWGSSSGSSSSWSSGSSSGSSSSSGGRSSGGGASGKW